MTTPLIDGDILAYEIGAVGQFIDKDSDELIIRNWEWVAATFDNKIADICDAVGASQKPIIFLTGDEYLYRMQQRLSTPLRPYKPNFRVEIAVSKPYKGGRKLEKPFHYHNLRAYMFGEWGAIITNGCEADDAMCVFQWNNYKRQSSNKSKEIATIICTRDKDLRQCPGYHYGWEVGKQPEFGPHFYDDFGTIEIVQKSSKKIVGGGFKFFCAQLLTGDTVDNIGGLKGCGPVAAYNMLRDTKTAGECMDVVQHGYAEYYGDSWMEVLREQCNLIWMVRELNEDGSPKMFNRKDWI